MAPFCQYGAKSRYMRTETATFSHKNTARNQTICTKKPLLSYSHHCATAGRSKSPKKHSWSEKFNFHPTVATGTEPDLAKSA